MERESKTEIYYFYQFVMTPYYYDSPLKKKPIHPMYCIYPFIIYPIYSPTLLQPFIYPFYCNNFCLFLYLLSMYRLIIYPFIVLQLYSSTAFNTYLVQQFKYFFYFKMCISSSFSELGD
jgi:hypothetical protein